MKLLSSWLVFVFLMTSFGCFRAVVIQAEAVESYSESELLVTTHDGLKFNFAAKKHTIVENDTTGRAIRGKARTFRGEGPQFEWFEGEVAFRDIKSITTPEETEFYYISLATIALTVFLAVYLALQIPTSIG